MRCCIMEQESQLRAYMHARQRNGGYVYAYNGGQIDRALRHHYVFDDRALKADLGHKVTR